MQTPAGRPRGKAPFGRCPSSRAREEGGGQVLAPLRAPPPARAGGAAGGAEGAQVGPRPRPPAPPATRGRPTRLPLAPLLSVTSYVITRADPHASNARSRARPPAAGPAAGAPQPTAPRTKRPGARLPGGGRAVAATRPVPSSEKALLWPVPARKPRASPTASASSNTFHGLLPAREPAAPVAGPRPRPGGSPPERRKFLGAPPPPAPRPVPPRPPPRRAARPPAPMSGWATCDPREPGRLLPPARLARSRGLPPTQRKTATSETSPGRAGQKSRRVPAHRPYLALQRPRSGRAARGAWCVSERARGAVGEGARAGGGGAGRRGCEPRGAGAGPGRPGGRAGGREERSGRRVPGERGGGGGVAAGLFTLCCPARGTARTA